MPFVTQTAESAKKFLLTKLQEQSARDNLTLTESEKRLFVFSEKTASTADVQGVKEFDASGGDGDYEAKIARLLRRAYRFDKKASRASSWKDALTALRDEDFYGLVMVDQAQIPRPAAWI